ncbi:hypothetical protein N9H80_00240 [Candidatus Pseudothioglobus singularis]|nr:hypothetical protein [Candidatus Pseudothioglobus singularis]
MTTTTQVSRNKNILYFAVGSTVAFMLYITFVLTPVGVCFNLDSGSNSLGLSFSYTNDMVLSFFESRSQEQLLCYSRFLQIWDAIFAIIYTLMYASWIVWLFNNKRWLALVPILGMISDWSENYIELIMIKTYSNAGAISETLVSLGSGINSFKWILSSLTYLIILTGIIIAIKNFLSKTR